LPAPALQGTTKEVTPMSYDVFLSHSHFDKVWTRNLCDRLATTDYNGRMLRAWLDQRVLDPGSLSSARELESALDRSRRLAVVLTPESLASDWVQHEIRYFLGIRNTDDVVLIGRRPCSIPEPLVSSGFVEWPESMKDGEPLGQLLRLLRPAADDMAEYNHRRAVRRAWGEARARQTEDFDPTPTEANHTLLDLLLSYDIADLDQEGPALAGFDRVGQLIGEMDGSEGYNERMILGEFLAVAVLRNAAYAQVAASFVRKDIRSEARPSFLTMRNRALRGKAGPPSTTNLLFAVARSGSKLAEIDPSRVDLSTMAAVLHRLDRRPVLSQQEKVVAIMVGRTLGKLRSTVLVDALLYALVAWGSDASHVAAAAAISTTFDDHDPVVFYTEELKRLTAGSKAPPIRPPMPRIARLLFDPSTRLAGNTRVAEEVRRSRDDFDRAFGAYRANGIWPEIADAPPVTKLENGPLVGTLRRVSLGNMESFADSLGPTDIACLTEPRIVDALFDGAGGYLIDEQQADEPLGNRLRLRNARFATCGKDIMDRFEDGSVLVLWQSSQDSSPTGFAVGFR
jgi:TIR domain